MARMTCLVQAICVLLLTSLQIPSTQAAALGALGQNSLIPEFEYMRTISLSDEEFLRNHEKLKAEIGDERLLAFRQAEIHIRTGEIAEHILSHQCLVYDDTDEPEEMGDNRVYLRDGRQFRVGKNGPSGEVLENFLEFWEADYDNEGPVDVPDEMLPFEVLPDEVAREEAEEKAEYERRQREQREQILSGELSVRDLVLPCECRSKTKTP